MYCTIKRLFSALLIAGFLTHGAATATNGPGLVETKWQVPNSYLIGYKFGLSFTLTFYYTMCEANKYSVDYQDWKLDGTTIYSIAWRSIVYGFINYLDSQLANKKDKMPPAQWNALSVWQNYWSSIAKTSFTMITYNSRYDETVYKRGEEFKAKALPYVGDLSALVAGAALFATNIAWFYTVPMLWSPQVNHLWNKHVPSANSVGAKVYELSGSSILPIVAFTFYDVNMQHILISLKTFVGGLLPLPSHVEFFRFPECTVCFYTLDLLGKKGTVGKHLYEARDSLHELFEISL